MFNTIRMAVLNLVEEHRENEVTSQTSIKHNGIYMLYVDNFDDDRVVPFYIGQSVNLQERYKQHYTELLALNRFRYDVYRGNMMRESLYSGISSYYEGHFKTCKIFKYMVEHGCSLADFHMIAIEENIDTTLIDLEELEQEYFEKYLPAFFGFNQMNTTAEMRKGFADEKQYAYMISDGKNLEKYIEYGYSFFNYLHAFPKSIQEEYPTELNEVIQKLWKYYDKEDAVILRAKYGNMIEKHNMLKEMQRETASKIKQMLKEDLENYFADNSLKSQDKFKMILEQLSKETPNLEEVEKYLQRYSKDGGAGLFKILETKEGKLAKLRRRLKEVQDISVEAENTYFEHKYAEQKRQYDMIFPQTEYFAYPLKANYTPFEFPEIYAKRSLENEAGVCQICIDYTMDRPKIEYDKYSVFLRVAYRYSKGYKEIKKAEVMIETGLEKIFEEETKDSIYYTEYRVRGSFYNKPFNPLSYGVDTMITLNMEYKTGINEYVLSNSRVDTLGNAFNEIEKCICDETEVILYSCTEGIKSKIAEIAWKDLKKDSILVKKILKLVK